MNDQVRCAEVLKQQTNLKIAVLLMVLIAPVQVEANNTAPTKHEAISALLTEAAEHIEQQSLDAAGAALERALRIDSQDAEIWQLLSELRSLQGDQNQAEAMAAKAATLRRQIAQAEALPDQTFAPTDSQTAQDQPSIADQDIEAYPNKPRTLLPEQHGQIANVEEEILPQRSDGQRTPSQILPPPPTGKIRLTLNENSVTTALQEQEQKPTRADQEAVAQALQMKQLIRQLQAASAREHAKKITSTSYVVAASTYTDDQAALQAKKTTIRQRLAEQKQRIRQRLNDRKRAIQAALQQRRNLRRDAQYSYERTWRQ